MTEEELANPIVYSSKIGLDDSFEFADNFRNGYIPAIRSTNDTILRNQGISVSGPTLVVMEGGKILKQAAGARPKKAILNML